VQGSLLDDLGNAIDRLIERCQRLDRDRTALAHALSRVQTELVRERGLRDEAENRRRHLEARQEEAALRLEGLLAAIAQVVPSGSGEAEEEAAEAQPPMARSGRDPLAQGQAKPFDIASLEHIARLAADTREMERPGAAPSSEKEPAASDDSAVPLYHDRLF